MQQNNCNMVKKLPGRVVFYVLVKHKRYSVRLNAFTVSHF